MSSRSPRRDRSRSDRFVHREDDFSDHVTLGEPFVCLGSPGEGIAFGDWNLELPGLPRRVEPLEFANARDAVIADQGHAASLFRRRLDAVRVCDTAAGP